MTYSANRILRFLSPLLVIGLGIALYAGTLNAPFTGDDVLITIEAPHAYQPEIALKFFFHDLDWIVPEDLEGLSGQQSSRYGLYRPMWIITVVFDTFLWHQEPFGWRLTSLILHLLAALAVLGLATKLLGSRIAGLAAALLFVAHPIHVETLANLTGGRAEILACLFVVLAWRLFLRGDGRSKRSRWAGDIGSAGLFLLGLWSKENAVVLPALLFMTGWALRGQTFKTLLVRLTPHVTVFFAYMILRVLVVGGVTADTWSNLFGDSSAPRIFLTVMAILARYLRLILLPYPFRHPECYDNLPSTVSVAEGVLSAVLVLGLVGFAVWRLVRGRKHASTPFWAFGLLGFFVCLIPVSHIVPFKVVMAARFLYLPSVALCLLCGYLTVRAHAHRQWLPIAAGLPVLAAFVIMTCSYNPEWVDPNRLYRMVTKCNPRSPAPYNNMGTHRLRQGKVKEALPFFKKAVELDPGYARARYNLAYSLHLMGRLKEAEAAYLEALAVSPNHSRTLNNLGILVHARGDLTSARSYFERALRADPRYPATIVNLGNLEQQLGNFNQAEKHFRTALQIAPRLAEARFNLGRLLEQTGRAEAAEREYREILVIDPDHSMAHNNLGNILKDNRKPEEAESHYQAALRADPGCAPAHQNLATLLLSRGDAARAAKHYQIAHRLRPNDAEILLGLGFALLQQGEPSLASQAAQAAARIAPEDPRVRNLLHLLSQKKE